MADARVAQSPIEVMLLSNPEARVAQSVIEVMLIAGVPPAPAAAVVAPSAGAGGFRPYACGCAPEVLQADRLRALFDVRRAWPFDDIFPPAGATPVQERGTIAAPAIGNSAVVVAYTVPPGLRFYLTGIFQTYTGGAFAPGDALWTVDVNSPFGISNFQGSPIQGLDSLPVPLGTLIDGSPWWFWKPYGFVGLDLVQAKVENVALGGGFFTTVFLGYTLPMQQ